MNWESIKDRLKSKVVWLAALAQILLIVGLAAPKISDTVKIIGMALVELATIFGILNNPTDKGNF